MGIFATTNFSLAMTLASLGVPFADNECPERREITSAELEANGWETIEDAEEAGFRGTIAYAFGDHPDRKEIIKAFNEVHHSPKGEVNIPDTFVLKGATKSEHVSAVKTIAMAFAFGFRNRKKFADRQLKLMSLLKLLKSGDGFAIIDRRSSAEIKEKLSR
jgi:hypothetical protein